MKKFKLLFIIALMILVIPNTFKAKAAVVDTADYLTYQEIIMSSGKLIKNYTEEETYTLLYSDNTMLTFGLVLIIDNQNVQASYISSVQECMENSGNTDITINVTMSYETNNKVSFTSNASASFSNKSSFNAIKGEIAAKAGIEYNETTYQSIKETKTMSLTVEGKSQYMVVITGNLSVTNGIFKYYACGDLILADKFEFVTLESQYAKLEKRSL